MNDVTRPMGFIFRDDLLFGFNESPYRELYVPPMMPHPIVQHMPPMDFAVSCSIDPGFSRGRPAMVNTGLWSMGPDYHPRKLSSHSPTLSGNAIRRIHPSVGGVARAGPGRGVHRLDDLLELLRRSSRAKRK